MGVVNMRSGQPTMALTGGALVRLEAMTPPLHRAVIHLSLTDDHPYAQAFVVIEAVRHDAEFTGAALAPGVPTV
jgi:holo-[acyl-carrier protein] synthase